GRDAVDSTATAPAAAARRRRAAVVDIDALEPDHSAAERLERQGPVEVDPEVTPAVWVRHGIGRRDADGEPHAPARCGAAGSVLSAAFSAVSNTRRASKCVSAMSRAARQWRAYALA